MSDVFTLTRISGLSSLRDLLLICLVLLFILSSAFPLLHAHSPAYFPEIAFKFLLFLFLGVIF